MLQKHSNKRHYKDQAREAKKAGYREENDVYKLCLTVNIHEPTHAWLRTSMAAHVHEPTRAWLCTSMNPPVPGCARP